MVQVQYVIHFQHFPEASGNIYWCVSGYVCSDPNTSDDCGLDDAEVYDTMEEAKEALEDLLGRPENQTHPSSQYQIVELHTGVYN